jgi:putative transposase
MDEYESLSHTKWDCKYHVIFIPKRRRKALYGSCGSILAKCFAGCRSNGKAGWRRGI